MRDPVQPLYRLELKLRAFSCLTVGDVIRFKHAGQSHVLDVLETRPSVSSVICGAR